VSEVIAVPRRDAGRQMLDPARALGAIDDLGDLPVELFDSGVIARR